MRSVVLAGSMAIILAACGGGGSADGTPSGGAPTTSNESTIKINTAPIANAVAAQSGVAGTPIALDGRASSDKDNDPLTYRWQLSTRPMGSFAEIVSSTSTRTTFTPDLPGTYVATLVVNDGKINSPSSTAEIEVAAAPQLSPLLITSITATNGTSRYAVDSGGFQMGAYRRAADQYANFWDFCGPDTFSLSLGCPSGTADGVERPQIMGGSGDMYNAELNANLSGIYAATLFTRTYEAGQAPSTSGPQSIVEITADIGKLGATPEGKSVGFELSRWLNSSVYATQSGSGDSTYAFQGNNDVAGVPPGWIAEAETQIDISIHSSWTDSEGRPAFARVPVFSKVVKGTYSETVNLPNNISSYPTLKGEYGTYSINLRTLIKFTRQ